MSTSDRSYSEKRDFIRMNVDSQAILKVGDQSFDARCVDMSSTGFQIEAETALSVGDRVTVIIPSSHPELKGLEADAEVLRVQATDLGKQLLGLSVLEMR
ncbi:PilZ domain-containing protein [uncultured Pseudomonas sp.]|uniref:PilZ domain-containing protein n=1 Tax=uncultured Pseudomonas sp. TaxID=114707 RepID=UPI0025D87A71|nr:PilZ domain-containing protein [uncultured Pseudomonas sp.]